MKDETTLEFTEAEILEGQKLFVEYLDIITNHMYHVPLRKETECKEILISNNWQADIIQFRNEVLNYVTRYHVEYNGEDPKWNEYRKVKPMIEKVLLNRRNKNNA